MFYEFQIDISVPNRQAVSVMRYAGDVVHEDELAPGSIESCKRLRQIIETEEPPPPAPSHPTIPSNGEPADEGTDTAPKPPVEKQTGKKKT